MQPRRACRRCRLGQGPACRSARWLQAPASALPYGVQLIHAALKRQVSRP